jgi:glycosyltransferase involved in cell wall biosynthesis
MTKVYINPPLPATVPQDGGGGILRVVEAQCRYLPEFDFQIASSPDEADLIANHGAMLSVRRGIPMVNHCHGLYWHDYPWSDEYHLVNKHVTESLTQADAITAPSKWVAHALTRGILRHPEVVYHGVDADAWTPGENMGYVLWNKARMDPVTDPSFMQQLAARTPDINYISTFGNQAPNIYITGAMPYHQMKYLIQNAGVYLATSRETFGIGTLEAMAAGVPVVGWDYGGQREIVMQGVTGLLAPFGDYATLTDHVRSVLEHRQRFSEACVEDARARWGWRDKIAQYAALYRQVLHHAPIKVSVIITCYNLAKYLPDALNSVQAQSMRDAECIIVDDASTDNTAQAFYEWTQRHRSVIPCHFVRSEENLKLSMARNKGFEHALGKYIIHLDADDMLDSSALEVLADALDQRPDIHIAYGGLDTVNEVGENRQRNSWPNGDYIWKHQMAHLNQLPYAAMMRRSVLENTGGYRARDWRAEDASLWCRATSFGFQSAHVTDRATLVYRLRSDSKTGIERAAGFDDGDWTAWCPWRLAGSAQEGLRAVETKKRVNPALVPWGTQGDAPAPLRFWPVRHHEHPVISVIIPCAEHHRAELIDALDSVQAQTFVDWECIVVNDADTVLELPGHPWAKIIDPPWHHHTEDDYYPEGAGKARNIGLQHARAPYVLFLDADDMLTPTALERLSEAVLRNDGAYAYSDWLLMDKEARWDGPYSVMECPDYDRLAHFGAGQHAVTCLIETSWAKAVGFDEALPFWEDWQFYADMAVAGYCGVHVAEPLLIYRIATGQRREAATGALREKLMTQIRSHYTPYLEGTKPMPSCCGGNRAAQELLHNALFSNIPEILEAAEAEIEAPATGIRPPEVVRMQFIGEQMGATTWKSRDHLREYQGGREKGYQYADVAPQDVEWLVLTGVWRKVAA